MTNIIFGKNGFVGKSVETTGETPTKNECDLKNYESTLSYLNKFKDKKINIINLAARVAGVFYNKNHNVEMLYENTLISLNLIKAIKELNLDCYLLSISSVCAYDEAHNTVEENFRNNIEQVISNIKRNYFQCLIFFNCISTDIRRS